ncbi:MAG: M48 family metallopeptidase [Alphaproteobacteria bacterium]|nr:M48 family metallopeptidase [Alphaproteobacteria bacterium]
MRFKPVALAVIALITLVACESAPITGRSQLILVGDQQVQALGLQAYQQMKQEKPLSRDQALIGRVKEVGRNVARISPKPDWDWEFNVFEDDSPNAFALPGGKVGVNSGLFKVAKNDDQLAAVIGHEVAHAIARHGAERMSQGQLAQAGGVAVAAATGSQAYTGAYAALAQLGFMLPNNRTQESEADHIGLLYMAEAGYDPRAAVDLWRNMEAAGAGGQMEWMSTHPSPGNRIKRLQQLMPRALEVYRPR